MILGKGMTPGAQERPVHHIETFGLLLMLQLPFFVLKEYLSILI
jgi:hypothetical protein